MAHQDRAYPGFRSMKRLGVFLLQPGWDASPSQGYPRIKFASTHLYTWAERGTANFQRKVTIICEAYCFQLRELSNDNSFGTKIEFDFSSEKSLCSINDFEHVSEDSPGCTSKVSLLFSLR